jgi:hypothetical protein
MCKSPDNIEHDHEESVEEGDFPDDSDDGPTEDESWNSEKQMIIKGKWQLDGCKTLDEVIERMQELIEYYKELKKDGWELESEIADDWGFLRREIVNS